MFCFFFLFKAPISPHVSRLFVYIGPFISSIILFCIFIEGYNYRFSVVLCYRLRMGILCFMVSNKNSFLFLFKVQLCGITVNVCLKKMDSFFSDFNIIDMFNYIHGRIITIKKFVYSFIYKQMTNKSSVCVSDFKKRMSRLLFKMFVI